MIKKILVLLIGCFAASSSVIFIKTCNMDAVVIAGLRLVLAAIVMLPVWIIEIHKKNIRYRWRDLLNLQIPALALSLHLITWTAGAKLTYSANATVIVNLLPIVMPFFLFFFANELINRWELFGTLLGLIGIGWMAYQDMRLNVGSFWGDLICLVSLLFLAMYLTSGKKYLSRYSLISYLVPVYMMAGLISLLIALAGGSSFEIPDALSLGSLIGMVLAPTIIGHSIINHAMHQLRGQLVSLANQTQFIFAGVMGFLFLNEIPDTNFYFAAILVTMGTIFAIFFAPPSLPGPIEIEGTL